MGPTHAIVFVLGRYIMPDAARCIGYAIGRGYHVIGIVKDDWQAATDMLIEKQATVIVAADPRHLDPNRVPRVEYVIHEGPEGQHRPRLIEG